MTKLGAFELRIRNNYPNLVEDFEGVLAEMREAQADLAISARYAGAREAFNTMRNVLEMKAAEVGQERLDPEWLARMAAT